MENIFIQANPCRCSFPWPAPPPPSSQQRPLCGIGKAFSCTFALFFVDSSLKQCEFPWLFLGYPWRRVIFYIFFLPSRLFIIFSPSCSHSSCCPAFSFSTSSFLSFGFLPFSTFFGCLNFITLRLSVFLETQEGERESRKEREREREKKKMIEHSCSSTARCERDSTLCCFLLFVDSQMQRNFCLKWKSFPWLFLRHPFWTNLPAPTILNPHPREQY